MRRTDREITDIEAIYDILGSSDYGTISMCDGTMPYAVPISCGFFIENGEPYLCWHGAGVGTKVDILRKNPAIVYSCVSECVRHFLPQKQIWTFFYKSACVSGNAAEVIDIDEKVRLLHLLLKHFGENDHFDFPMPMLKTLSVWKCRLTRLAGKQNLRPKEDKLM